MNINFRFFLFLFFFYIETNFQTNKSRTKPFVLLHFVPDHNIQYATRRKKHKTYLEIICVLKCYKIYSHFSSNMHNTIIIYNPTRIPNLPFKLLKHKSTHVHTNKQHNTTLHGHDKCFDGFELSNRQTDWHVPANMLQARSHRLLEMLAYLLNNMLTKEKLHYITLVRDKKSCIFGYKR